MKTNSNNLDLAMAAIRQQFGSGSIQRLGDTPAPASEILPTGSLAIDVALGAGGLPLGRIAEIYGPESSGKTTFCLSVLAQAQRRGGTGAFIDVEHALDPHWARRCGVDVEQLVIAQPDSGEEALEIAEMLIRSAALDVVVVDSVAALAPKAELEAEMGDAVLGAQARLMGRAMRKLVAALHNTQTLLLVTTQLREKIGVIYGSPEYQPGGKALKFFASVRLDIRRKDPIKSAHGTILGHRVRVKVVKNKIAPPFLEAEFDIMFSEGISRRGTLVDCGIDCGLLEKSGTWYSWAGEKLGQGRDGAKEWLGAHPAKADELEALLRAKLIHPAVIAPLAAVDPAA